ncbi:hypothetical protein HJA76_09900 [Rhizobium bangladeshense]|uniref:hypothetical protein n=1 Tax=Rhizobium bangladeshense TaxID=1138189 RepID=UPI001C83C290|nr:hypothetical protein [Rhizobium bangladeshense]MBX4920020.1 hypothetical protein [Rhizobium bangladeshense]
MPQIIESNAVQMLLVSFAGVIAYGFYNFRPWLLAFAGVVVAVLIHFSFLFDVGEVYSYSDFYKRAFWYFGDDVTTCLAAAYIWSLLSRRPKLGCALATAILLSGGRIGVILVIIQIGWLYFRPNLNYRGLFKTVALTIATAVSVYYFSVIVSPTMISVGNEVGYQLGSNEPWFQKTTNGADCIDDKCFEYKVKRPLRIRVYGAIAGLWMTLDGGYPGLRFPNTPEKLADLMTEANPWGLNDRLGITRQDWLMVGTIQSPYLQFGAGYGPFFLIAAMSMIGLIGVVGFRNLVAQPGEPGSAFAIFFVVNAIFNQTQAWLLPGPILFVMALCGTNIMVQAFLTGKRSSNQAQSIVVANS